MKDSPASGPAPRTLPPSDRGFVARTLRQARELAQEVFQSLFHHDFADSFKTRCDIMYSYFILHIMPVKMHRRSLKFRTTLGLGVISLVLFVALSLTGVVLMFHYVPSATMSDAGLPEAYERMLNLRSNVGMGVFLRNMHRWAAHAMVALVVLHMARVFLTGSYKRPRQMNWVIGVILVVATLLASYTGYLLPWDQLSFWGVRVGTEIARYAPGGNLVRALLLGDADVGQEALIRFYVLHCMVIPGAMLGLIALHMWRIRKDGGLARPDESVAMELSPAEPVPDTTRLGPKKSYHLVEVMRGKEPLVDSPIEEMVFSWPAAVTRIAIVTVATMAILSVLAVLFNAPLEEAANAAAPPNPAKAPWYFLGLQELVSYDAFIGGVAIPGLVVALLFVVPYIDRTRTRVGVWFARERWLVNALFLLGLVVSVVFIIIGVYFRGANWGFVLPWAETGGH